MSEQGLWSTMVVGTDFRMHGSSELLIQLRDNLLNNAVSLSRAGEFIQLQLSHDGQMLRLDVSNPGPWLPDSMRRQLLDSMVFVPAERDSEHPGLGLAAVFA